MKLYDSSIENKIIQTICNTEFKNNILSVVDPEWFGSPGSSECFQRITVLMNAQRPIPSTAVLADDDALSDMGKSVVSNSDAALRTKEDVDSALALLENYRKSRLIFNCMTNSMSVLQGNNPAIDEVVRLMEQTVRKCSMAGSDEDEMIHFSYKNREANLQSVSDTLDNDPLELTIPTGFGIYDKNTGGFKRKNVISIASVPGGGKSTMALQMSIYQYMMGYNVCLLSYEMDKMEIMYRALSAISQVSHKELNLKKLTNAKRKVILKKFDEWLSTSQHGNTFTIWTPSKEYNINEIAMIAAPFNYDVIYVDYLGLLKPIPNKQMHEVLGEHARSAKIAASSLNNVWVLLAQYDDKENKLKYSQAITAHSNFVWVWDWGDKERESGIIEVKQMKARGAAPYNFYLQADYSVFSICDYTGPIITGKDENEQTWKKKHKKQNETISTVAAPPADANGIPKMPKLI